MMMHGATQKGRPKKRKNSVVKRFWGALVLAFVV
jgi:hypothetical protein